MKLSDYIRGLRKGKDAHRLEKESMKDLFFADALDGFHQAEGDSELRIEQLRKQVAARLVKKIRNRYIVIWSIAACLVMGFGITSYLLFLKKDNLQDSFALEMVTLQGNPAMPPAAPKKVVEETPDTVTVRNMPTTQELDKHTAIAKVPPISEQEEAILEETAYLSDAKVVCVKSEMEEKEIVQASLPHSTACELKMTTTQTPEKTDGRRVVQHEKADTLPSKVKRGKLIIPRPVIGRQKYRKYLRDHLIPPTDAACREIKGEVVLAFYVDAHGNPINITVTKGLCKTANKEAIRLVRKGPRWTVGHLPVEVKVKF